MRRRQKFVRSWQRIKTRATSSIDEPDEDLLVKPGGCYGTANVMGLRMLLEEIILMCFKNILRCSFNYVTVKRQ